MSSYGYVTTTDNSNCTKDKHQYAENDSVPAEACERVLLDECHKLLDYEQAYEESSYHADNEKSDLMALYAAVVLKDLKKARTEHYGDRKEESKLCSCFSLNADGNGTNDC